MIAYNTSIVRDGLVLHLDAANVKSYPGSGTVWKDLSGLGNDGTLVNGVGYSPDNKGAIVFDGVDDYVNIGSDNSYNAVSSITIELVFNRLSVAPASFYQVLFSNSRDCCGVYNGFQLQLSSATQQTANMQCVLWNSNNYDGVNWGTTSTSLSGSPIITNKWHHIVYSYNILTGAFTSYRNGIVTNSLTKLNALGNNSASFSLQLGKSPSHGSPVAGYIPVSRVYNRALSAAEIQQNFEAVRGRYNI